MDLDDVLKETPEQPQEQQQESVEKVVSSRNAFREKEQAAQAEGRPRDEQGKFVADEPKEPVKEPPKEEPKVETKPVQQEMSDKERAFLAQAQDERRKRQQLEQEIATLRAQQKPPEPPKPFFEDPDGALGQIRQEISQHAQQTQQALVQQRVVAAEFAARARHQDFDEMVPVFGELLQETPGLYQAWLQAPDPAEFAYKTAKNMKMLRDAGSLETIKAQAEKEARIKLEAEYKAKEQALLKQKAEIPGSLSDARSASQPKVTWGGPTSLDNILHAK
jgi:hypothetical protein